ncbi:hypothetical protein RHGRI_011065 [Rhododendron griersonianum]|uniref:Uncharacterized protein n=1 Tax=Rhododendron griersonianum TaxID=479676 RepID=A0AAV6KKD9_9ERIC|nr:hypothetical protein RHGRI_011065 [Rhododendron griersonianum]
MDSTEIVEGFVISTTSVGTTVSDTTSKGDTGDIVMEERRTVEGDHCTMEVSAGGGDVSTTDEPRTEEGSIGGDTVMGEHRMAEEDHRTVEEPIGGGSIDLTASTPVTPAGFVASTPITPAGSVVEMEIGGLDVSVERRAMEERGTPASAILPELPFTPLDTPTETENREVEDEDAEAVAQRLVRGKSVVGESDRQEVRDPLAIPLFTPPIGSSREQGVSLRDTLECADPQDLSARLAEAPSLASVLASEEAFQEAEREEEERQRVEEGPRVTLVQEVEAAAKERAAFSETSYVHRVHFFVPFGVDAFVPRQSLQEEQVLHDPGSHLGLSSPLSEVATGASGSRGSRRGGATSMGRKRIPAAVGLFYGDSLRDDGRITRGFATRGHSSRTKRLQGNLRVERPRERTKIVGGSPLQVQSPPTSGRVLRERRARPAVVVERGGDDEEEE